VASAEKRYTLTEAQIELAKQRCALAGHVYEVLDTLGTEGPDAVLCSRCGRSWKVENDG
jgi:hypothetical protein